MMIQQDQNLFRFALNSRIVTASIAAQHSRVYTFASNPANMPQWAPAFVKSIANVNSEWIIDSNLGKVKIEFASVHCGQSVRRAGPCGHAV